MLNVLAAVWFLGFVVSGILLTGYPRWLRPGITRQGGISLFIGIVLVATFVPALLQRDLWPFSPWPLVAGILPDEVTHPRLMAVDVHGNEFDVDYRACQPLEFDELMSWMDQKFTQLSRPQQDRAAGFLLSLVNRSRERVLRGGSTGYFSRWLGPFTAPYFLLHPSRWSAAAVPRERLVGLRFYRETWNLYQRADQPNRLRRTLIYQFNENATNPAQSGR